MKSKTLHFKNDFKIRLQNRRSQAAEMVLAAGDKEGGNDNRHRGSDQWLFVVSGRGSAVVNGKRIKLKEGSLLLIERGELHEIRNTGRSPLKTLNIYVPPAYSKEGNPLPRGRA
jgi:mannose-6-phosphate isomerase-like protein (cupin superfamily)